MIKSSVSKEIVQYGAQRTTVSDSITVEEPLEIRLEYMDTQELRTMMRLAVTMRTPSDDRDLVRGFLFTEGIIEQFSDIIEIRETGDNIVTIVLDNKVQFDPTLFQRNFYASSSCGVCGKASIESIQHETIFLPWKSKFTIASSKLMKLPDDLRQRQVTFMQTGGIHACALYDKDGQFLAIAEDVGRHTAMDKLIGSQSSMPIHDTMVIVSGRASFELVQKASRAGIGLFAAIGAPSSLAVDLATEQGMTLIGFLKSDKFNCYNREDRIV